MKTKASLLEGLGAPPGGSGGAVWKNSPESAGGRSSLSSFCPRLQRTCLERVLVALIATGSPSLHVLRCRLHTSLQTGKVCQPLG